MHISPYELLFEPLPCVLCAALWYMYVMLWRFKHVIVGAVQRIVVGISLHAHTVIKLVATQNQRVLTQEPLELNTFLVKPAFLKISQKASNVWKSTCIDSLTIA